MLFTCSQLCDEIDEHEKNSPDTIEEEKKKIPGIWMKTKWIEGINYSKIFHLCPATILSKRKKTLQLPCRASKKKIDNNDTKNVIIVQWNPVNMATNRPWKFGHVNRVAVLTG